MIFHETWRQVLDGEKIQTRRLKKEEDELISYDQPWDTRASWVERNGRLIWETWQGGKTYAIQPGRGKKSVGRFRILKIREEKLQDISIIDCYAEGIVEFIGHMAIDNTDEGSGSVNIREHFGKMWDSIHPKGKRWEDNPEVWVLEFELVEQT